MVQPQYSVSGLHLTHRFCILSCHNLFSPPGCRRFEGLQGGGAREPAYQGDREKTAGGDALAIIAGIIVGV